VCRPRRCSLNLVTATARVELVQERAQPAAAGVAWARLPARLASLEG
jgi:hypothetical protein